MTNVKTVFLVAGAVCFFVGAVNLPGANWISAGLGFVTLSVLV